MAELKKLNNTLGGLPDERGFSTSRRGSEVYLNSTNDELIQTEPPIGSLMDYEEFLRNINTDADYYKFALAQGWAYYMREALVVTDPQEVKVFNEYKKQKLATQIHTRECKLLEEDDPQYAKNESMLIYDYTNVHYATYDFYAVLCPYGKRKGMKMEEVYKMVKRRWAPKRLCITYEDRDKLGHRINPHYNILFSTDRYLKSYNCNNINVDVRCVQQYRSLVADYEVLFDYIFKTYFSPERRECVERRHYMVESKGSSSFPPAKYF